MKRILLVLFLLTLIFFNKGFGQDVSIDFSGKADTTVTVTSNRNSPNCNGATTNCIIFTIKLSPNADLLNFQILNPAPPGASAFYILNCDGIQRSLGTPICITGNSTVTITYCKTGNDRPDYIFTSSTAVKASPDLNLRQLCSGTMNVTGLQAATVTWTSIFPGAPGQYDNYLSSPTGSLSTNVTPAIGAPATILYKVSGNTNCALNRSDTVRVNTYAPLTVALTPASPVICATGGSITLTATPTGGNAPYTYSWTGPNGFTSSMQSITATSAGAYTVNVSDNIIGCGPIPQSVTVTAAPTPVAPTAAANPICAGSAAIITATTPAGTYNWYSAASGGTPLFTGASYTTPALSATTTYYVDVTSAAGCTSSRTAVTVTVNPIPMAPTAASTSICNGSTATLSAASASGGTYDWFAASSGGTSLFTGGTFTTPALTVNTTYYVQTTVNGCISSRTAVNVTINPTPVAPTANGSSICSGNTVSLSATAPGGNYQWYDAAVGGNLLISSSAYTTPVLTTTTTYYVQTTVNGCVSARTAVTVTVNPLTAAPTVSGTTVCEGDGTTLTASAPGGTYRWYSAASGGTLLFTGAAYATPNLSATTTYYVDATSSAGCTGPRTAVTVTVTPRVNPAFTYSSGTFCKTGTNPTPSFVVPSGGTFSSTTGLVFVNNQTGQIDLAASTLGTYIITFTTNTSCAYSSSSSITITDSPNATFSYTGPYCQFQPNPLPTFPLGASAGIFSCPDPGLVFLNAGTGEIDLQHSLPGTYMVTNNIAASGGCAAASAINTVTINPTPVITSAASAPVCSNTAQSYTITSNVGIATFSWSRAAVTGISNGAVTGQTSSTITETLINTTNAPINVIYTIIPSANSCNGAPFTYTVTVNPTPGVISAASSVLCNTTAQNYSIQSNVTGATFNWSRPIVAGISNGAVTGQTSNTITETLINTTNAPVNVVYTIVPSAYGCDGPAFTYTVTVNPTPTVTNNPLSQIVCSQSSSVAVVFTSNASGVTMQWTATASPTISGFVANGTGDLPSQTLVNTGSVAGTIDYLVTPYFNGCPGTPVHYIITVNPKPATPVLTSNSPVCQNYALTFTTPAIPGASYLWTGPNGFTSTLQNPIISNAQLAAAGQYSLVVTVNGCASDAGIVNVAVLPTPPAPVAASNGPLCAGNTLMLTANSIAGATYSWTGPNGFTSSLQNPSIANITTTGNGMYSVTATLSGCTSTAGTIMVVVNAIPTAPVVTTNGPVCEGNTIILGVNNLPGATYTWTGPNNFFSNLPNPTIPAASQANAGVYTVTATVGGCTGPATSVTVVVDQIPINPVASSNSPVCTSNTISLNASTFAGAVYHWTGPNGFSSNLQNPVINNASAINAGTYTVSITAPGCSVTTSASTVVVVNQTPVAPTANSNSPVCIGNNLNLAASNVAGAIYSWVGPNGFTSAVQNPVINNASAAASGAYSVTVTVNGCTSAITTTNVIISAPKIVVAGNNQVVCANNANVTLAGTITNNNTGSWTSSGTGTFSPSNTSLSAIYIPSAADIATGNITLTLSSVNNGGCGVASSSMQVTITPTPIVNAGGNKSMCATDPFASLGGSITYSSAGKWTTSGTGTFSPSENTITANYIPSEADKATGFVRLTLTSTGNNCLETSDEMTLTIIPSPTISMPDTKYILQGESTVLNPVVAGSNLQYSWIPAANLSSATVRNPVITGGSSQLYTLTVTGTGGCIAEKQIMVYVLKPIVIPNTFTPNGDGINDKWAIKELATYPTVQVTIFNRYGTKLYQTRGYDTPWDGNYNGQQVPVGTYYYVIDLGIYGKTLSGYIVVLR